LFPDLNNQAKTFKGSQYEPGNLPRGDQMFYASAETFPVLHPWPGVIANRLTDAPIAEGNPYEQVKSNLLKGFALAVYKIDAKGELITKGPEVERRYLVKYVSPALKDFPEAYHNLTPLATYASAYLPPAKLFFRVEDIQGKEVALQNPLI